MSNYRTDEQQREIDLQGWWNACEKKDAEIERQAKEIAKLRRKSESQRKRLADAERDLKLLERVRASASFEGHVEMLRAELLAADAVARDPDTGEQDAGIAMSDAGLLRDLIALLSPDDAGRGEGT